MKILSRAPAVHKKESTLPSRCRHHAYVLPQAGTQRLSTLMPRDIPGTAVLLATGHLTLRRNSVVLLAPGIVLA